MGKDTAYEVFYARATYGEEEKNAVAEVLDDPQSLVGGSRTNEFESTVAQMFGKDYGVMVNSGSSANLLAVESIQSPSGSEVITPATTFSTTVAPIIQNDLVPVFVDIDPGTYQVNTDQVANAVSDKTKAIMVPSLVGNVPDLPRLRTISDKHDLHLIEDSADTIGAKINGRPTGAYSDITTTSFYASHIITAFGGGGMYCANDESLVERAKKLRGWGRRSAVDETENIDERLDADLGGITYDHKFVFDEVGYNFLALEASAAFGLEQLAKLDEFAKRRQDNFERLRSNLQGLEDVFVLPEQRENVETNWLAFPLTVTEAAPFDRPSIVKFLEQNGIQTRSLWSGNITRHPALEGIGYRIHGGDLPVADEVMKNAFVVGCHQSMGEDEVDYVTETIEKFVEGC